MSTNAPVTTTAWPMTVAERLALFMHRYGVSADKIAQQLCWPVAQLQTYIDTRHSHEEMADRAVENLLLQYQIVFARQRIVKAGATRTPLTPVDAGARRTVAPSQFARHSTDPKSIVHTEPTTAQLRVMAEAERDQTSAGAPNNRKRKRQVVLTDLASIAPSSRYMVSNDTICPIRIDVDVDGIRYQDTFLLDTSLSMQSPEIIAEQIAHDEKLGDKVQLAIAESVRRQLVSFTAFIGAEMVVTTKLYLIYLDLIVDGLALRDQFEWDITNTFSDAETFANTLCADLNLPDRFEAAIIFSMWEQVIAYRRVLYSHQWVGNNPFRPKHEGHVTRSSSGYIESLSELTEVIREREEAKIWQPVLSELSKDELQYLSSRSAAARGPTSWRKPQAAHQTNGRSFVKRPPKPLSKEQKGPRPINPFIMFCHIQKDMFIKSKTKRSAADTRKIMGDMWRKCTDEEKEHYARLTEIENENRRREHILELRDRAIAEWEEEEARRKGLLASSILDASTEHFRGLLLANYMSERHEVDSNREDVTREEEDVED